MEEPAKTDRSLRLDGKRILVADDDRDILNMLSYILEQQGAETIVARNGNEACTVAEAFLPDLVVMDVMMPGMDGVQACIKMRRSPTLRHTPIILLTALDEEGAEVRGLDSGADDYVSKPVVPRLLLSHVRAVLRRSEMTGRRSHAAVLEVADLEVDRDQYVVRRETDGEIVAIELSRREFDLLFHLASRPGRVFSRQELLNDVWGVQVVVTDRTVDVHVSKLREKLGDGYIETVKGVGYRFRARS
jgi:two-component system alkaline phosphatase synthesis response regulator PhoP